MLATAVLVVTPAGCVEDGSYMWGDVLSPSEKARLSSVSMQSECSGCTFRIVGLDVTDHGSSVQLLAEGPIDSIRQVAWEAARTMGLGRDPNRYLEITRDGETCHLERAWSHGVAPLSTTFYPAAPRLVSTHGTLARFETYMLLGNVSLQPGTYKARFREGVAALMARPPEEDFFASPVTSPLTLCFDAEWRTVEADDPTAPGN